MNTFSLRSIALASLLAAPIGMAAPVIPNPSFELDTFTTFPGYVSGNALITGWTGNEGARVGLNPAAGSPFANNGSIPAGAQVAFIQSDAAVIGGVTLSTVITDLVPSETYKVTFRVNARTGNTPMLKIDIDSTRVIDTGITAVGGSAPYKYFTFDFTATAASHTLTLRNDAAGDHTVVIDDFTIEVKNSGWSYAAWTDDLNAGIDSSKVYTHAYSFGAAVNTTIEGIAFTGVAGGNPTVADSFTTTGLPNVFNNDPNNLAGGSRQLANDFLYGGAVQSITINGLVPGGEYVATIYAVGWENGTRAATFSVGDDRLTVNQDQFGDNNGIRVSYRYVASSNSITLTYVPLQANTFHTYGFANYIVSIPAAPAITAQPRSRRVGEGEDVTFSVTATGDAPLSYTWFKDGVELGAPDSSTLALVSVTEAEAGVYSVIVSNLIGSVTSSNATLQVGLPIVNRSFEANSFSQFPGYVSANGPITGWDALGGHGLNPAAGSPFADNGLIPDGLQVAFMQMEGALSQLISGFTVGDEYYVLYSENARSGGVPALEVKIDDTTIVPAHSRAPVGGGNPYVEMASEVFTATATDMLLSFIKSNPNGGDTTMLIDNVVVLRIPPGTAPFVSRHPQPQIVTVNNGATFSGAGVGSLPLTYQWLRNGSPIDDATNATFSIASVAKSDEADYALVIVNDSGSVTSAVARLTVFEPIGSLFNTGLDGNHVALADGAIDPNYSLVTNPDVTSSNAIVENSLAFPIVAGPWLGNSASSKWIGPRLDTAASAVGLYTYRTTFHLTNRDPSTVVIIGRWASDNSGRDILVNGVSTGNPQSPGFDRYTGFNISTSNASFLPGVNTIDFVVENEAAIGYTGLRVEFTQSNARILPNIPPEVTAHPVGQTAVEGDNVTLTVTATGSDPLSYQWLRNGVIVTNGTNRTLTLPQVTECDSAEYQVIVSNGAGSTSSVPAVVSVAFRRISGVYGTGVDDSGALLPNGSIDLHYTLISSADPNFPGPDAIVINDNAFPIPPWLASGPNSKWIGPQAAEGTGLDGVYTYQTFIDLTGVDLSRFRLAGGWAVDNAGLDILVNANPTGLTSAGFGGLTPFTITSGFIEGINSVEFVVSNAPPAGPTGLRVDLQGLIDLRPTLSVQQIQTPTNVLVSVGWSSTNTCHRLQFATDINGPWTTVESATNPQTFDPADAAVRFFRLAP